MARLALLTDPAAVERALDEYDTMGRDAFLAQYGFAESRVYYLLARDRRYDSKPVVAAAWGFQHGEPLPASAFSGGEKTVGSALSRLGFEVAALGSPEQHITRDSVLQVLAEIDRLGETSWLAKWDQNAADRYYVVVDGKRYPAKAVIAVAAAISSGQSRVAPGDWRGEARTVVRPLRALGFTVDNAGPTSRRSGAAPSVFGEIPGYPPGSRFDGREQIVAAGLHRHLQAGISGNPEEGADAIVVSGGYVDDEDFGDRLIYTGQGGRDSGGRQVSDQTLTKGNLGLVNSEIAGLPVRVIRGSAGDPAHSPSSGYRYDGLFTVTSHWVEPSQDGPSIFRYELIRSADADGSLWIESGGAKSRSVPERPIGNDLPQRVHTTVQRVVRNTAVAQWVKETYDYTCQACGTRLDTPSGPYAEGAHIKPLGGKHAGRDAPDNILCLCANCHVQFDKGTLYIVDENVMNSLTGEARPLLLHPNHSLDDDAIQYHRARFVPR
jgi:putative restriction endonuclease